MAKIDRTKLYSFVGDVFEHYPQDRSSTKRTHTDCGWRLRSRKYGSVATFAKLELSESLIDRPCPLKENEPGVYILTDSIFPHGFYIGKGKDIADRIWKHGVKLDGTDRWNKGVDSTIEFERYRQLRLAKGLQDFSDIQIGFWFTDKFKLESELMGAYYKHYGMLPFCNSTDECLFQPWDI